MDIKSREWFLFVDVCSFNRDELQERSFVKTAAVTDVICSGNANAIGFTTVQCASSGMSVWRIAIVALKGCAWTLTVPPPPVNSATASWGGLDLVATNVLTLLFCCVSLVNSSLQGHR